jgi:DNA-binding MarR family transcriptional regulator
VDDLDLNVAWQNLARVSALVRLELERTMEREGRIGLSEGEVLYRLAFAPDGCMRMGDIADALGMAQSGVTRVVDRLVDQGLVVRAARSTNRRTVDARITPEGRDAFERLRPAYMAVVRDRLGAVLSDEEVASLRGTLRAVLEGLGAHEEVPWARDVVATAHDADGAEPAC